ncbi:MAG: condensation domain-containing protein, partial [Bacteroidota bacterium]
PITNTRVYILDKHKNLLPIGVPGEIHVSGRGLAVGYLCRPELTKQKFVSSPFAEGERLYCTGDLGKWNMNGDLEFLGRIDEQVKVRGYRVELSEIERHILECEWMSDAKVILKEEESTTNLIGFLIGDRDHREELIAHLSAYLPHYMIPDNLVYLDSFPLTVHGKIDLKRLSDHKIEVEQEEYIAPTSELEKTITNFCEDILGKTRVSTADSFFKLGGDSIKAIQLSSKMNTAGYRLEVADILKQPIISKLVQLAKPNKTVVNQEIISGEIPLTPIQHWFLDTPRKEYKHYNQAILLKLKQPLNTIQLEQVAAKLQLHHDALRIIFSKVGRVWEQNNLSDDLKAEVGEYDLGTGKHATERLEEITTDLQRTLDINQGPLMKMVLFHIDGEHRLLITVHHLVIDGVSWRIILQDIDMLITQLFAGDDLALPPKTSSFQSWSFLLQRYAKSQKIAAQREYWQKELSNYTPSLQRDFDSKENTVSSMASSGFKLSNQLTTQLLTTAHNAYTSTINELLLSALVMSLNSMWISDNILIWLEGHGREKIDPTIDVTRTVGWFTTVFPVNFTTDKTHQWDNTIVGVKDKLRNIPGKGLGFGVLKYLKELQEDTSFHLD